MATVYPLQDRIDAGDTIEGKDKLTMNDRIDP